MFRAASLAVGVESEADGSQHGGQHWKQPQEVKQLQLTSSELVLHGWELRQNPHCLNSGNQSVLPPVLGVKIQVDAGHGDCNMYKAILLASPHRFSEKCL